MRSLIDEAAYDQPSLLTFCQRLEKRGLVPELYQRGGKITGIAYLYQNQRMAGSVLGKSYSLARASEECSRSAINLRKTFDSLVQMGYTRLRGAKAPWPSRAQIAWMLRTGQLTPRIQQWMKEKGTDPEQFENSGFTYEQLRDELQQLSHRAISQHSRSYRLSHNQQNSGFEL